LVAIGVPADLQQQPSGLLSVKAPTTALLLREEADCVFVEVEPWVFEPRSVETSFQMGEEAIIGRGLKAGERVVVKGGVLLND
jgi:membrane fusion protein, heavy metal efflux system